MLITLYTPLPWQLCENISCKQASQNITGAKKHIYAQGLLNPDTSRCHGNVHLIIMELGRFFVRTNLGNRAEGSQQTRSKC